MDIKEIKRIDIKEFRESGYLQELNRRFLHPLGLALEIEQDESGNEKLGGIWDYRDDPEGMIYDIKNSSEERINKFSKNKEFIDTEFKNRFKSRIELLKYAIEPINNKGNIVDEEPKILDDMDYSAAIDYSFGVKWKTEPCGSGVECWCRLIVPEEAINDQKGNEIYIAGSGCIPTEYAEHIVKLHNEYINK